MSETVTPEAESKDQSHPRLEKAYWWSQIILACLGVGGILIAVCTLRSLNDSVQAANRQANAAATANALVESQLKASTRPILTINQFLRSCYTVQKLPCVEIDNSGKSAAVASVHKYAAFSSDRLPAGPPLPDTIETLVVPPTGPRANRIDFDQRFINKPGYFYLVGKITYGTTYYTCFCREYAIPPGRKPITEHECQDRKSNDIK